MFKVIGIIILVLIVAILAFAATRPDTFRVERSATIQAPPEKILPLLEDFHRWTEWSPWEKIDPNMQRTHGGAPKGKGAVYAWQGNSKAGAGRMEILESSASQVAVKLDFSKPFEAHNLVDFTLHPQAAATNVTWSMHGPQPYMMKVMCIFVSMDSMVGKDFEAGLANLKRVAEQ